MCKVLFPRLIGMFWTAFFFSLVTPAFGQESILFSCGTLDGRFVEVTDYGDSIGYRFGRELTDPELKLRVARETVSTHQWPGVGRDEYYSVTIPNGETEYTVFFSIDKSSPYHQVDSGINVIVAGQPVTRLRCMVDTLLQTIEGVDLTPAD